MLASAVSHVAAECSLKTQGADLNSDGYIDLALMNALVNNFSVLMKNAHEKELGHSLLVE